MSFPADRFARAGATPDEVAQLQAAFLKQSASAQATQAAHIAGISDYDIAAEVVAMRDAEPDEEPAAEPETPVASTATSTSSSGPSKPSDTLDSTK